MPEKKTIDAAKRDKAQGKSPSTQAGEFVKEEIDKVRHGEHGVRSAKQAIAIGLSEARRAGVQLKEPSQDKYSEEVVKKAQHDSEHGEKSPNSKPNPKRSQATSDALKRERHDTVSHEALSEQAKKSSADRSKYDRSASALKAAQSRTPEQRSESARKAAETRKRNGRTG